MHNNTRNRTSSKIFISSRTDNVQRDNDLLAKYVSNWGQGSYEGHGHLWSVQNNVLLYFFWKFTQTRKLAVKEGSDLTRFLLVEQMLSVLSKYGTGRNDKNTRKWIRFDYHWSWESKLTLTFKAVKTLKLGPRSVELDKYSAFLQFFFQANYQVMLKQV